VRIARDDEAVRRLTKIPGIGTINATALAAAVGNARECQQFCVRGRFDHHAVTNLSSKMMAN
jgi:hypothetical protein